MAVTCPMYLASVLPRPPAGAEQRWCQSLVVTIRRHPVLTTASLHVTSCFNSFTTDHKANTKYTINFRQKKLFYPRPWLLDTRQPLLCLIINIETLDFTRQGTNNETWEYWEQWHWEMQVWRHCPCIVTDLLYGGWAMVGTGRGRVTARQ